MDTATYKKKSFLRHAKVFLQEIEELSSKIGTHDAQRMLKEIDNIKDNIKAAFAQSLAADESDLLEITRDFAIALFDYYDKRSGWDQWEYFGSHSLNACKKLGDAYSMGEAYPIICNDFGIVRRMQGKNDEAMLFYEQALEKATLDVLKSDALTNMADIHRLRGQSEQAMQCAQQAIELGQQAKDSSREAKGLEYLGLTHTLLGEYDRAIELYERALRLRRETDNYPRIALALTMLSYALTHRGREEDLHQAIKHYNEAQEIDIKLQNLQAVARYLGDIAVTHNKLGDYQEAIDKSERALSHNETIGFWRGMALNHVRLSESYLRLSDFDKASLHVERACENLKHLSSFDRKMVLVGFCSVLLDLAKYMQSVGNLTEARVHIQTTLELATEMKANDILQAATNLLQQLEKHERVG